MSTLIQDWRELTRAWKQFAAALLSISADDLARSDGREVTRLAEERKETPMCPLSFAASVDCTERCSEDACAWWDHSTGMCAVTSIASALNWWIDRNVQREE